MTLLGKALRFGGPKLDMKKAISPDLNHCYEQKFGGLFVRSLSRSHGFRAWHPWVCCRVNLREFRRFGRLVLPCFAFQFCLARSRAGKGNAW